MLRTNSLRFYRAVTLINFAKVKQKTILPVLALSSQPIAINPLQPIGLHKSLHTTACRDKYKKETSNAEDSDDENDDHEFKDERDSKVVKTKVNSLRADLLLKAGLGMARNKVETFFYESKIRVNGKKIPKKSVQLEVGDEIDVIRGFSQSNPAHLVVARVIILAADEREDGTISVHLRRFKSFLIENYSGVNTYKSSESVDHQ